MLYIYIQAVDEVKRTGMYRIKPSSMMIPVKLNTSTSANVINNNNNANIPTVGVNNTTNTSVNNINNNNAQSGKIQSKSMSVGNMIPGQSQGQDNQYNMNRSYTVTNNPNNHMNVNTMTSITNSSLLPPPLGILNTLSTNNNNNSNNNNTWNKFPPATIQGGVPGLLPPGTTYNNNNIGNKLPHGVVGGPVGSQVGLGMGAKIPGMGAKIPGMGAANLQTQTSVMNVISTPLPSFAPAPYNTSSNGVNRTSTTTTIPFYSTSVTTTTTNNTNTTTNNTNNTMLYNTGTTNNTNTNNTTKP